MSNKWLRATRVDGSSSALRVTALGPACLRSDVRHRIAMDILHILRKDSDQAVEIHDDRQASAFLRQIGIKDAFTDRDTLAVPTVQICGFDGIRSHFILAFLFSGCTPAKENGYLVTCAPRNGFEPGLSTADFVAGASRDRSPATH